MSNLFKAPARCAVYLFTFCLGTAIHSGVAQANMLLNPSFEGPHVTSSSNCGSPFDNGGDCMNISSSTPGMGWTVDGNFGNGLLNLVNNNYNEDWANPGMLHFYAQDGNQSIDLTGTGDQGDNGISQTVSTVAGQRYLLTFYVGHADDHYIVSYSGPTTVGLKINGIEVGTFVNNADTLNQINWTQNSYDFLANSNITTISFYTRNTNNYAGLDNVSLEPNPEPGTFWMMGGAVFLSVLLTRRVRRSGVS